MKTPDQSFSDWEGYVFGAGYGTGEQYTVAALRTFLGAMQPNDHGGVSYRYADLEAALTPTVAWLLINTMVGANIIDYGTSPRFAWLSPEGVRLREYMLGKTVDELLDALGQWDAGNHDYIACYPDHCNCVSTPDAERADGCVNPFWTTAKQHRRTP